jgi:hypothetical protein
MTIDDAVCVRADVDIVDLSPPTNFVVVVVVAVNLDLDYVIYCNYLSIVCLSAGSVSVVVGGGRQRRYR